MASANLTYTTTGPSQTRFLDSTLVALKQTEADETRFFFRIAEIIANGFEASYSPADFAFVLFSTCLVWLMVRQLVSFD